MEGVGWPYFRNLYILSISFLFVFTAFNAIQNLEATILSDHCRNCDKVCDEKGECEQLMVSSEHLTCAYVSNKIKYCSPYVGECRSSCPNTIEEQKVILPDKTSPEFMECGSSNNIGSVAIGVIYGVYTCSCLVGVFIARQLGEKRCFTVAFTLYSMFCAANVVVAGDPTNLELQWKLLLPSSALVGFAASFLWIAQGTYLTTNAEEYSLCMGLEKGSSLGRFTGVFYGVLQSTQIIGSMLATLFLQYLQWTAGDLMKLYLCVTIIGTVGSLLVSEVHVSNSDNSTSESFVTSVKQTIGMWKDPKLYLLIPLISYVGFEQAFLWGVFNRFIKQTLGISHIGMVMTGFGIANVSASVLFGRLSDAVGRVPILLIGGFSHFVVLSQLFSVDVSTCQPSQKPIMTFFACLWGIGDSVFTTQMFAIVGEVFSDQKDAAFSNQKLWQSAATSLLLLLSSDTEAMTKESILKFLCGFLLIGFTVFYGHWKYLRSISSSSTVLQS